MAKKPSPSKKPSDASSNQRQHEEDVFFIDRSLGRYKVPEALKKAGLRVEIHDDHFAENEEDPNWLAAVGENKWIVLTKDKWIRRRPLEKQALLSAGLCVFVLTSGNMTGDEMAQAFVKNLSKIRRLIKKQPPPFIAAVTGTDVQLLPVK